MLSYETTVKVRYMETDKTGFVHYANYLNYLDVAAQEYLEAQGEGLDKLEEKGYRILPINLNFIYKMPIRLKDTVVVRLGLLEMKSVKASFEFEMMRAADGRMFATGKVDYIGVTTDNKLVPIKQLLPKLYQEANE